MSGSGDYELASAKRRPLSSMPGWQRLAGSVYDIAETDGTWAAKKSTPRLSDTSLASPRDLDDERRQYSARSNSFSLPPMSPTRHRRGGPFSPRGLPPPHCEKVEEVQQQQHVKTAPEPAKEPYHIFSHRQKWQAVMLVSISALLAGLSSNIYFPAQDEIARVGLPPPPFADASLNKCTDRTQFMSQGIKTQSGLGTTDRHLLFDSPGVSLHCLGRLCRRDRSQADLSDSHGLVPDSQYRAQLFP